MVNLYESRYPMERAAFMRGNFGLMTHWLHSPVDSSVKNTDLAHQVEEWNQRVDAFDVKKLATQLSQTKAKWFILTIGQNTGFYCAPNQAYDEIVGYPESKCSRRDLFKDLATELQKHNIKTIAYIPSGAPDKDRQAMERLEWTDATMRDEKGEMLRFSNGYRMYDKSNHRLENFQRKWEHILSTWAKNWGSLCAGWWVDGIYFSETMYDHKEEPNFNSLAAALRAGNPEAAITFNPGIYRFDHPKILNKQEDYSSGELASFLFTPFGRANGRADFAEGKIGHAQLHLLAYLGGNWGQGPKPRYSQDLCRAYTQYILDGGGGMTWDIPTNADGEIPPDFHQLLCQVGNALNK